MSMSKSSLSWGSLFLVTLISASLYIFSEWLFAVTKPSYLNSLGFTQQIQVLFVTSILFVSLCFLGLLPLLILNLIPPLKSHTTSLIQLGAVLPTVVFAALILLLVDNFTYTLFKFGIVTSKGWQRGLYGMGFVLAIVFCFFRVRKALNNLSRKSGSQRFSTKWVLSLVAGALLLYVTLLAFPNQSRNASNHTADTGQNPHILLITSDGIDATHTSVYGYERDTTPHLQELAGSTLIAENAFSNSGNTAGSILSIYTGKYPAKTRVINRPDILTGEDAYEHLPGILRQHGYKTVQISLPYFLDANELNVLDGFDEVKTGSAGQSKYLKAISKKMPIEHALFIDSVIKRIADRIRHIFFIKEMTNPYLLVTAPSGSLIDLERLNALIQSVQQTSQPIFIHVHFMVTHGGKFNPTEQIFSAGQSIEDQEEWEDDFYDDSILDFDKNLGTIVDFLANQGLLDKTILIIGSDHGQQWDQLKRIPLMIRFPNGQYAGRIQANVQMLDIPVTILDFIGIEKPDWMSGHSLIAGPLDQRPIFGVNTFEVERLENGLWGVNWKNLAPPFYQFSDVTMIYCQKWYKLGLTDMSWETGNVIGSTSICAPGNDIKDVQAFQWMVDHLRENGFDVSALEYIPQ